MKTILRLVLAVAILAAPGGSAFAKKKPAPIEPGDYAKLMERNLHTIGRDLAGALQRF